MNFDEKLRQRIATASAVEKSILKVVLGEFQQKNANGKATEQEGIWIVEKIVKGNSETLGYMKPDDPRRLPLEEESRILSSLLPPYLSVEDVLEKIKNDPKLKEDVGAGLSRCDKNRSLDDIDNASHVGKTIGVIMKWCKANKFDVKGDTIKEVLVRMHRA